MYGVLTIAIRKNVSPGLSGLARVPGQDHGAAILKMEADLVALGLA